jgi:outer membrane lipoprotein-sorting protein
MRQRIITLASLLLVLTACSTIWAQALSRQMTNALLSMESYHGSLSQTGLLPERLDTAVVQDIWYQKPWRLHAQVTAPQDLAGSLFIYDGEQLTLWWPNDLLGIRVRGLENPGRDQVAEHITREVRHALDHYAFSMSDGATVAGQDVTRWRILPLDEQQPWRLHHTSWNYEPYALPLKMSFTRKGELWYGFEFTDIAFDVPVPDNLFEFRFPDNALVFEWDMNSPGIPLAEAQRTMNFQVMQPDWLPEGHALEKIVPGESCLPMLAMTYNRGASVLTLTQSRAFSPEQVRRFGKPVQIGERTGWLYFVGNYSVLSWTRGHTLLTLMSNLSFPQVIRVARSVQ